MDKYSIIQTCNNALVYTKVLRGPWHVITIATYTERGGRRQANRIVKRDRAKNP